MRSLHEYLDQAIKHQGLPSDRQLAFALGINPTATSAMRLGKSWPADETMIRLAHLAGVDPEEALLDLNIWRSKDDMVRMHYMSLARRAAKSAAALLLAVGVAGMGVLPDSAKAGTAAEHHAGEFNNTIYYAHYEALDL